MPCAAPISGCPVTRSRLSLVSLPTYGCSDNFCKSWSSFSCILYISWFIFLVISTFFHLAAYSSSTWGVARVYKPAALILASSLPLALWRLSIVTRPALGIFLGPNSAFKSNSAYASWRSISFFFTTSSRFSAILLSNALLSSNLFSIFSLTSV